MVVVITRYCKKRSSLSKPEVLIPSQVVLSSDSFCYHFVNPRWCYGGNVILHFQDSPQSIHFDKCSLIRGTRETKDEFGTGETFVNASCTASEKTWIEILRTWDITLLHFKTHPKMPIWFSDLFREVIPIKWSLRAIQQKPNHVTHCWPLIASLAAMPWSFSFALLRVKRTRRQNLACCWPHSQLTPVYCFLPAFFWRKLRP